MQNWTELYKELCALIKAKVSEVKWQDLWHNQVNFLESEHPFPSPALFYGFRTLEVMDLSKKVQKVPIQVDVYVFFETFADTYDGSWNQESALGFLGILSQVHAAFHGSEGTNYSNMRRKGFSAVDTGGAGNTYLVNFTCEIIDYSAVNPEENANIEEVEIEGGGAPAPTGEFALFSLPS